MRSDLLATALLLSACGGPSTQTGEDPSAGEGELPPQVSVQQPVPENLVDDQRNEAVPLEPPAARATPGE